MNMDPWKKLYEHVRTLSESTQYRGQSDIKMSDLKKLADVLKVDLDPRGGMLRTQHKFSPKIWTGWQASPGPALAIASTDTKRQVQTGTAQGGTVHKTAWGGKVSNVPAPIRPHADDALGSRMDRYDVIMMGEIEGDKGLMTRIAWSPAMGSSEERRARLENLLAGKNGAPLQRRPQPDNPTPPDSNIPGAQPVPRVGQNLRTPKVDDED